MAALVLLLCAAAVACARPRPNVILITLETTRADHLGAHGHPGHTSPNLDSLAAQGVVFDNANTVVSRTTQSIATILTGRLPGGHGVMEVGQPLPAAEITLAEILSSAGYQTAAVSASHVAGRRQRLDQGFDSFVDKVALLQRHQLERVLNGPNTGHKGQAEAVTDEALAWLDSVDEGPFFLWLFYFDPHWPYNPPDPYNRVVDWHSFDYYMRMWAFEPRNATVFFNLDGSSAAALPELRRLYASEIRYTDAMLGKLLQRLRRRGLLQNTLLVITADHGESLGEHGCYYQHGESVFQPEMHVPLLFHLPGRVPEGRRVHLPVSTADIMPTILSVVGVQPPNEVHLAGLDLSPVWSKTDAGQLDQLATRLIPGISGRSFDPHNPYRQLGGSLAKQMRYARTGDWLVMIEQGEVKLYDAADSRLAHDLAATYPDIAATLAQRLQATELGRSHWRTVRQGDWKLVEMPELEGSRTALFDLSSDPDEQHDLTASQPEIASRLRAELARILPSLLGPTLPEGAADPDDLEILRSLGYLE